jgi:hypothetical protein
VEDGCLDTPADGPGNPIRVELKEKHQARYAELRRRFEKLCRRSAQHAGRRGRDGR